MRKVKRIAHLQNHGLGLLGSSDTIKLGLNIIQILTSFNCKVAKPFLEFLNYQESNYTGFNLPGQS